MNAPATFNRWPDGCDEHGLSYATPRDNPLTFFAPSLRRAAERKRPFIAACSPVGGNGTGSVSLSDPRGLAEPDRLTQLLQELAQYDIGRSYTDVLEEQVKLARGQHARRYECAPGKDASDSVHSVIRDLPAYATDCTDAWPLPRHSRKPAELRRRLIALATATLRAIDRLDQEIVEKGKQLDE